MVLHQYFYRHNVKTVINSQINIFISSLLSDPGSFAFQLFGSKYFGSSVQRSRFFSILALQFEDLGSLVFQLFGLKVPVFSILALRFKGPGSSSFFGYFSTLAF
ncbi:unnamed protein product [Rhizophagus irregularis]|nr:unnamed protein product [Rhizophagus irregularis]